ncbi:MoaD/ThiS family protein [Clostridiaceae bacterium 35-E11]
MKIVIKLKGPLQKYHDGIKTKLKDLPVGMSIKEIISEMNLPREHISMVTVNGIKVTLDYVLQEDAEIQMFPYVSGG